MHVYKYLMLSLHVHFLYKKIMRFDAWLKKLTLGLQVSLV